MKRIILAFLFFSSFSLFAQKCKLEKPNIDKFTGSVSQLTKKELLWKEPVTGLAMYCQGVKVSNQYLLSLTIRDYDIFSINKGDEIQILFIDKSILTLKSISDNTATAYQSGSNFRWELCVWYSLSDSDYELLTSKKVETIRINGFKTIMTKEIPAKNSGKISMVLNCIR